MRYVVIVHPDHHGVLVTESGCLPLYKWEDEYAFHCDSYQACERMKSVLKASFDLNFLRYEAEHCVDFYHTPMVTILEIPFDRSPAAPPTYKWIYPDDVEDISVRPPNASVVSFLALYKTQTLGVNEGRLRSYSKEGWFASACEWIRDRVVELTESKVVEIVKIHAASNACVLRAQMSNGSRYFMKCVMKRPHDEVQITSAIHTVMNDLFGDILFIEEERRFMLMRDYGTPMLSEDCHLSCNGDMARDVMRQWVLVQKESLAVVAELCSAGVPRRGGRELRAELEVVASDVDWFQAELAALKRYEVNQEFTHGEYKRLFLSAVEEDLKTVEDLKLPMCLVHGDLQAVNIIKIADGGFTFFDFEGAIVSYPFLDALNFLFICKQYKDVLFEDISFYLGLWGVSVTAGETRKYLDAMQNIGLFIGVLFTNERWRDAEDSARKFSFEEMGTPVYRFFKEK